MQKCRNNLGRVLRRRLEFVRRFLQDTKFVPGGNQIDSGPDLFR